MLRWVQLNSSDRSLGPPGAPVLKLFVVTIMMIIMTMMMTMTLRRSRPARRRLAESASPRCVLAAGSASTISESSPRPDTVTSDMICTLRVQVLPLRRGEEVARELPQVRGVRGGAGERGIVLREGGADILQRRLPEVSCVNFHNIQRPPSSC